MSSTRLWDRAANLPVPADGPLRPELVSLPLELPSVDELFTFARDAELRFATLRMRIEDRTRTAVGEHLAVMDVAVRHPGDARVTTAEPERGATASYETWISDGETVRTYSAIHRLGTQRPVRRSVVGLDGPDLPGTSTVYRPLTALPTETLPDTFVHPAGFCQNVLATGRCWVSGTAEVELREAVVLECDHPRTTEVDTDRPDHHLRVLFDRETGVIVQLIETVGETETRNAVVVLLVPDASLQPDLFGFTFPTGTTLIY
jgi:outer membrane lipoprotein-sorting protein